MNTENDSNPGIEEALQGDAEDTGSDSFFDSLEQQVNGQIHDGDEESTQPDTEQVTQMTPADTGNEEVNWREEAETLKDRYSNSTREAQRLKEENNSLQHYAKYQPLIDHLSSNPESVQALRTHINGESDPVKQFGEDFVFDAHEAMTDPKSDSSKALKQMIDSEADKRVNQRLAQEQNKNQQALENVSRHNEMQDFMQRANMNEDQMTAMQDWAEQRTLSFDDIHHLMNKEQAASNVANNTKQEMLNQMQAVRNIPTSASNANSAPDERSPDDAIFDILKGMDDGAENLFG
jgi:hypothetical protein